MLEIPFWILEIRLEICFEVPTVAAGAAEEPGEEAGEEVAARGGKDEQHSPEEV
tara:strand:+ start:1294 stop:1455 length:162 start_codon:yes stop_codon:yes gene_type:complete